MVVAFLVAMHVILFVHVAAVVFVDNVIEIIEIVFWIFIRCGRFVGIRATRVFRVRFRWFFQWFLCSAAANFGRPFVFRRIQRMDAILFTIFVIVGVASTGCATRNGTRIEVVCVRFVIGER